MRSRLAAALALAVFGWVVQGAAPLPAVFTTLAEVTLAGQADRLDYQSLDAKAGLLFIAHLGSSRVHVVDVRTHRVITDIPDVAKVHGVLAVPELKRVYASATQEDRLAVIDETTLKVIARVPTGRYPDGIAYAPKDHEVFTSDEEGGTDTVIDTVTNRRVATVPLGGEAGNTQYDPGTNRILVNVQTLNQLVEIDPRTRRIVARHALSGADHNHGLAIDSPHRLAFVACEGNAKLLVVDLNTWKVLEQHPVGEVPDVLAFDLGRHLLFVASESGVVSVFKENGRSLSKLAEGLYAPHAHTVAVDPTTHRVFFPLQDVGGRPVLRVAAFREPSPQ
jgi:YVTN family beta-propeller protein